jgi:tetratricopeptide (TPR) repeat protein
MRIAIFLNLLIIFWTQDIIANQLSCEEQHIDPMATKCGKLYESLHQKEKQDSQFDFFSEWFKHKDMCSKTGEYEIYLADNMQVKGKNKEAEKILRRVIKEKGNKYDIRAAYWVLMQSLTSRDAFEESKVVALEVMRHYPYWYRGYLNYGWLLVYDSNFLEAKKYLEKSIELENNHPEAYALLGVFFRFQRDNAMAVRMYKKAISLGQNFALFSVVPASLENIRSAMMQKDYKLAAWILEKQVELYPKIAQTKDYQDLKDQVMSYFNNNIIDPFTPEERKALAAGADPLDIIGRN